MNAEMTRAAEARLMHAFVVTWLQHRLLNVLSQEMIDDIIQEMTVELTKFSEKRKERYAQTFGSIVDYGDFLGRALYLYRFSQRKTQKRLAELARGDDRSITQDYLSKVESGAILNIPPDKLAVICKHLNCRPSEAVRMAEDLAEASRRSPDEMLEELRLELERCVPKETETQSQANGWDRRLGPRARRKDEFGTRIAERLSAQLRETCYGTNDITRGKSL